MQSLEFRVQGSGFRFWGSGFKVYNLGLRGQRASFKVKGYHF
jgi:hypothetical protein